MKWDILRKEKYFIGLIVVILCLVVYKYRFLSLPYYWDEAWPYSVAVHTLYDHGLSLLPDAIPSFISRGHPLMFFFLAASWMKLFGTGLVSGHSFAITVSILLIIAVYIFCSNFFSKKVGLMACILLVAQAVFIAQSSFLMPEMMMALWTMLCLFTFYKRKKLLFILFAVAMLLTKESGGVLIISIGFCEVLFFIIDKNRNPGKLSKDILLIASSVALAFIYYLIQRIQCGFFLYPFYMNYIATGWAKIPSDLQDGFAYLMIYDGRNGLSIFLLLSLVIAAISKKINVTGDEKKILISLSFFIVFYLLFSSVNYYIPRYLLCTFPPFIIIACVLIDKAFSGRRVLEALAVTGLVVTGIFFYLKPGKRGSDKDVSYSIQEDEQVVSYFEREKLYTAHIATTSVLRIDFHEPYAGYLSGKPFQNVEYQFSDQTEYCIISNDDDDKDLNARIKSQYKLQLVLELKNGPIWREVYKVIR